MYRNKLILLLQSLSEKEWSALKDFLRSPFFNKETQLIELLEVLASYLLPPEKPLPGKEQFFNQHWPDERWDSKAIDYQMSKLNKLTERFFAVQSFEAAEVLPDLELLDVLSRKGLRKAYRQIDRKLEKELAKENASDKENLFLSLRHAQVQEADFGRSQKRKNDSTIEVHTRALDHYYYASRLSLSCNMLDRQAILNTTYHLNLSPEWIAHLREKKFFNQPIIEIYFTIYQTLIEGNEPHHFSHLKTLLKKYQGTIAKRELADIYLLAINYCARQIRQRKTAYLQEALDLYQTGIENQVLYQDGYLSPWTFTNVIKLFLGLKAYDKAEVFIETYKDALSPGFGESAVRYNLAELYYYTQRYDDAQEQLNQVEYTDPNFYLGARELLAKIYYETGAEESLLSLLASFTMFLKRNKKLSNNLKQPYLNFCRLLLKIVRRSKRDLATLEQELSETPLLASRSWLQKMDQESRKHHSGF